MSCQTCRSPYEKMSSRDFSRHCKLCGLFRRNGEGFIKSYPASTEGYQRWEANFRRRVSGPAYVGTEGDVHEIRAGAGVYYAYGFNGDFVTSLVTSAAV